MASNFPTVEVSKNLRMLYSLCLLICWLSMVQSFCPCHETISSVLEKSCRITETASPKTMAFATPTATRRRCAPLLFSTSSDDENDENEEKTERQWDDEESLLVMNLSPLPNVTPEDSLSRISQYIQSFPFAAVLPVQPLQALPTDDGGLEVKFLRKKTHIKSGVDGGVRFFVRFRDEKDDSIEVLIKRNSDGQSIPKMIAEKLIVQSFVKGMALGSDYGNDNKNGPSAVKVPNTRIESPTKDMAQIQSVFHKWI